MASIRKAAQWVLDDCRDSIGWVAIWKEGRSWESDRIYGVDFDERTYTATIDDADELEKLQAILTIDPHAIIVNGYYHNLGDPECMTRDTLADALRWQYELQHATVADFIEYLVQPAQDTAADEEPIASTALYIIDYTRPDGRADFKTVEARNEAHAAQIFSTAGIDGWTGHNFKDYKITSISCR